MLLLMLLVCMYSVLYFYRGLFVYVCMHVCLFDALSLFLYLSFYCSLSLSLSTSHAHTLTHDLTYLSSLHTQSPTSQLTPYPPNHTNTAAHAPSHTYICNTRPKQCNSLYSQRSSARHSATEDRVPVSFTALYVCMYVCMCACMCVGRFLACVCVPSLPRVPSNIAITIATFASVLYHHHALA